MRAAFFVFFALIKVFGAFASATTFNDCSSQWREVDWKIVPFIDLNAKYYSYQFKIPAGKKVQFKIEGTFPIARYMSFHVYDQLTEDPISRIADTFIDPNDNSVNPFRPGIDRYSPNRDYSLWINQLNNSSSSNQTLWLPSNETQDRFIDLWYRVYVNEETNLTLPRILAFDQEKNPIACPEPHLKTWSIATEPGPLDFRIPTRAQENKIPAPFKNGEVHFFKPSTSSLGANLDNKYLSTRLDGKALFSPYSIKGRIERRLLKKYNVINNIGDMTVLRFKTPSFPDTLSKLKYFTGNEDVRYWSLCLSDADTSTEQCLMDSQVQTLTNARGEKYAVVVVGPDNPKLKQLVRSKHYNFLNHAKVRAPLLFFRQMLANPNFTGNIEKVSPLPESMDPEGDISPSFFGETAIDDYSPFGRQCWYRDSNPFIFCGLH